MAKKRSTFRYVLMWDLIGQIGLIVFCFVFTMLMNKAMELLLESDSLLFPYILITLTMFCNESACHSSFRYGEYQMFCFTRQRFYRQQIVLSLLRMSVIAIAVTLYYILLRDELIRHYVEEWEMPMEIYTQTPAFWEVFLVNLFALVIANQILLILNTSVFEFYLTRGFGKKGISSQHILRKAQMEVKYPKAWKWMNIGTRLIGFVLMVGMSILISCYGENQLIYSFPVRMTILTVLIVVWLILCFIGKNRFVPKYV